MKKKQRHAKGKRKTIQRKHRHLLYQRKLRRRKEEGG
jgi:hypothetical protein